MNFKSMAKGIALAGTAFVLMHTTVLAETLNLGHHHAVGGTVDVAANLFAKLADEKTEGRVIVRVFPAAQLGQEREAYDLVEQGGLDISITSTGFLDKNYPPISLTSMPFIFSDWDHAFKSYNGEFGDTIRDNVRAASNTEILAYLGLGFRNMFFTGEPVTTLAGMEGLKMRSPENFAWVKMYENMKALPTPITWGEVYTAMQVGVAQGFDAPPGAAANSKLHEVSKAMLKTNHMFAAMVFAMNKEKFNTLSAEDQALVVEAAVEAATTTNKEFTIPAEEKAFALFESTGVKIVEPDNIQEWRDAMKPLIDEVVADNPGADKLLALTK